MQSVRFELHTSHYTFLSYSISSKAISHWTKEIGLYVPLPWNKHSSCIQQILQLHCALQLCLTSQEGEHRFSLNVSQSLKPNQSYLRQCYQLLFSFFSTGFRQNQHTAWKHKKEVTSARGRPPLYLSIRCSSLSCVTFNFTFCFGVRSPLSTKISQSTV